MIGKWHLGNAQMKQTPIGKGFDFFTGNYQLLPLIDFFIIYFHVGIYMWDIDSYTKQMHEAPWADPMMIDWVVQYQNGSFRHFAEPLHATEAITKESMKTISRHASNGVNNPLFLYVPFTAAHSPLQPMPRHAQRCHHIPHPWRREFCGMVVGLDEAIQNITEHARKELGENTIVIVASDNGGSPWFGGMNVPLRGSKITPLEGGVRVPGLIYDMTSNQRYLGSFSSTGANKDDSSMERKYFGLMHFADWFPTILSFAGIPSTSFPPGLDEFDMSKTFPNVPYTKKNKEVEEWGYSVSPRQEMLLEMYYANESIYKQELVAYRMNDYKLIKGTIRDINYYEETTSSLFLNISSASWLTRFYELFHHFMETFFFDEAAYDHYRLRLTHGNMQRAMTIARKQEGKEEFIRLYNIRDDPRETTNLVHENWTKPIITAIEERIEYYRLHRRIPQSPWLQFPLLTTWAKTHVPGDCSMNRERIPDDRLCRFAHPWIPDVSSFFCLMILGFDCFVLLGRGSLEDWRTIDRVDSSLQSTSQCCQELSHQVFLLSVALTRIPSISCVE
jgi:arylsulfatase A-like enzyme